MYPEIFRKLLGSLYILRDAQVLEQRVGVPEMGRRGFARPVQKFN
jgi:hypothetical protein